MTTGTDKTPLTQEETIASIGTYGYGWHDSDAAGMSAQRGLSEEVVRNISALKSEPEWMLKMRLKGLDFFGKKPMPPWGADLSGIHFDNIKYFVRSTEKQATSWDDLPDDIKATYDRLGIPEAEKQRLVAGVAAQYESEVVYHQIREDLEQQGVLFLDTDTALREHPEIFEQYFGTVIPAGDNKFAALNTAVWSGRLVRLRPAGRPRRHPAPGLLPHQHGEHGPVRADAHHRRRGLVRALRRGLHRAHLLLGLAPQRGRGDHREEERARALHDHPELVEQRLQPRHQAGDRRRGRHHGMGRRQHRLQGDDEVPGDLPAGRARARGDAVHRLRGRRAAPGRRGQDGPRRAPHVVQHRLQVRGARGRAHVLPRPRPGPRGRAAGPSPTCCATRCSWTRSRARTPTRTWTSAKTTSAWATRPRSRA